MQYWQHPNNVVLGGRIANDLVVKDIKNTTKLLEFTVANNMKSADDGGNKSEKAHYFRCEAWGKLAEIISRQFQKGDPITVIGTLNWQSWQDKDTGAKRESVKLRVESFHFVSGSTPRAHAAQPPAARTPAASSYYPTDSNSPPPEGPPNKDDDIPF